jgi:hypothetical protein
MEFHELHGDFQPTVMLCWLFTFLFNINHSSSKKKTLEFQAKKSIDSCFLTTTCNTVLASEYRSCMSLILYGQSFESCTALFAEDYDNPIYKSKQAQRFSGACFCLNTNVIPLIFC